ncbi:hypothetical protein KAFR_0H00810 [Kazachstania africana CBS 2517]|uniref:MRH domain-containing protein n=1 Tax=Kazachstania africana (strain ATCC 22294 / BCRC 22015 / CBS 2517 / CECT 1963 / NBRC 1671 / NRRL Y-8276) TaxID=1071382 RepID=H2AYT4_KAZAF|nr:hypothetical protein KAFR_0H00810 [Kazachstania africana CBS 2517]CCF59490.1 hypothetical protein KAFR_0H00810 [Kazachstania africana CBS 2517]
MPVLSKRRVLLVLLTLLSAIALIARVGSALENGAMLENNTSDSGKHDDSNKEKEEEDLFCAVLNPVTESYIDLSPLSATPNDWREVPDETTTSKTRWLVKGYGSDKDLNFTLSICSSSVHSSEEMEQLSNHTGGFYNDMEDNLISIGDFSSKPILFGNGNSKKLTLKYENGSICPNGVDKKSTLLNFICDKEISSRVQLSYVGNLHDCSYFFEARSIYACPTTSKKNGVNAFGIFFGIFAVFGLVEIGRRWLINKLVKSSRRRHSDEFNDVLDDNDSNIQPRWEFFEDQSIFKKFFVNLGRAMKRINHSLISLLRDERNASSTGPIRLSSNSQTSFFRDMEVQNNIIDSLDVSSSGTSATTREVELE